MATWKTKGSAPNDSKHFLTSKYDGVLLTFILKQTTKAHRGSRGIALLFL